MNVNNYFERIGYTGGRTPALETLQEIVLKHTAAIPFENLDPFLKIPVQLDDASLESKIISQKRGGYCFEQNLTLKNVLTQLGFTVKGLAARVLWNQPEGALTARTHMLLVSLDEKPYLVDVGFGGLTLTGVLRLEPDIEQTTPHEPFRLKLTGSDFFMQALVQDEWKSLYRFDLQEQFLPDYELASWYLSNNPKSHFTYSLIAARQSPGVRYALRNNAFAVHYSNGETEKRVFTNASEIIEVLKDVFLLEVPKERELSIALRQLIS